MSSKTPSGASIVWLLIIVLAATGYGIPVAVLLAILMYRKGPTNGD